MRKRFEQQLSLGIVPINEVRFNEKSRHELKDLLKGLQYIFVRPSINEKVFSVLESRILSEKKKTGRYGMSLWEVLVLSTVRLGLDIDYDGLHDLANNHIKLRQILGVNTSGFVDFLGYELQTIKDNVKLLDLETINSINQLVVEAGHSIVKKKEGQSPESKLSLELKGDSYVLESNIHFPVDLAQLWDSNRKVLSILSKLGKDLPGLRELESLYKKLQNQGYACSEIHRKKGKNYQDRLQAPLREYLKYSRFLFSKGSRVLNFTDEILPKNGKVLRLLKELSHYLVLLQKCIDLVDRRLLQGQTIAHQDKIFSIFELEVEWISKGKAGKSVEFGHRHLIYSDQYSFILHQKVLYKQTDKEVGLEQAKELHTTYGQQDYEYKSLSLDRGFYSEPSKKGLGLIFERVVMPKPGKKSELIQAEENQESFVKLRHRHSAVESNINSLEHTGLNKCPDKGFTKFKNYAATGVLAYNLRQLGKWITKLEQTEAKPKKRRNRQRAKAA